MDTIINNPDYLLIAAIALSLHLNVGIAFAIAFFLRHNSSYNLLGHITLPILLLIFWPVAVANAILKAGDM